MARALQLILLGCISLPAFCAASETCPWINAGTAAGILGGSVNVMVTRSQKNEDDATCTFAGRRDAVAYELHVEVTTMTSPRTEFEGYTARCGSNATPLKAIGSEAVICASDTRPAQLSERVVGRVRNRAFVIRISTNDPPETRASIENKARSAAEQVAGNLF